MRYIIKVFICFSIFLGIFSCRNLPENGKLDIESISTNAVGLVKINLSGVECENNSLENNPIAKNNSWGGG